MPYSITRDQRVCPTSKPWAVKNSDTNQLVPGGCHPTQGDAMKHQRALMANVTDARPK